ncbi:glycosyltransferase family 2 protein [Patescibacteria group bacterium]|nr:glycosyltransferase family 2 protein [Patescibacteria group bacterium]MBU1931563.1 glycosyltransferase family 2 protein [Patescibacteria group bacterium]
MKKVAIIILNYNGREVLPACLASLQLIKVPAGYQLLTILVDNASIDNSQKQAVSKFPQTILLQNQANLGFSKAMNKGIKKALNLGADLVLLLNNDTQVAPNFLNPLLTAIKQQLVGIVGPILKHQVKQQIQYDHGGWINWLLGRTEHFNKTRITLKKPMSRDFVSGACVLVKKEVFEQIGFLDERYFFYFEDVDFCVRAKKTGWQTLIVPNSIVRHQVSAQANKSIGVKFYHQLRSNLIFSLKHQPWYFKPLGLLYVLLLGVKIIIKHD